MAPGGGRQLVATALWSTALGAAPGVDVDFSHGGKGVGKKIYNGLFSDDYKWISGLIWMIIEHFVIFSDWEVYNILN